MNSLQFNTENAEREVESDDNADLIIIINSSMGGWPCDILGDSYCTRSDAILKAINKHKKYVSKYLWSAESPGQCDFEINEIMVIERG